MIKKIIITIIVGLLISGNIKKYNAYGETSGSCGDNMTWNLENDTLTISGTGAMNDFSGYGPWTYSHGSKIKKVIISSGITSIGKNAFSSLDQLTSISIPSTVTSLGSVAFGSCKSLSSINISDNVTSIGSSCFSGCESLTSFRIPENLKIIESGVFSGCKSLTTIHIPASVTTIEAGSFNECTNMTTITIDANNKSFCLDKGVILNASKSEVIVCPPGKKGSYAIPSTIKRVGNQAFWSCRNLTSIYLPKGLEELGRYAFYDCTSVKEFNIPSTVTLIENGAFAGTDSLESLTVPGEVEYIAYNFCNYSGVKKVVLSEGIKDIGKSAFSMCEQLSDITLPESLKSIAAHSFYYCKSLKSIKIPRNVTSISSDAFDECTNLTSICGTCGTTAEAYAKIIEVSFIAEEAANIGNSVLTIKPASYDYDGNKKEPGAVVKYGSVTLTENEDYTLKYSNNKNAGTAKVTVKGIGNYTGEKTATFVIKPLDIKNGKIVLSSTHYDFNGSPVKPLPTVTLGDKTLKKDTDYEVSYEDNVELGTATVVVTGMGNYTGELSKQFIIKESDFSTATITLSSTSYTYDGTEKKPSVTVIYEGKTLIKNQDYTVSYSENKDAGKAAVTVIGKGNYVGSLTKTFTINKAVPYVTAEEKSIVISKTANINGVTTADGELTYQSYDEKVATVDDQGVVKALKYGETSILVKSPATRNYQEATCEVTIKVIPKKMAYSSVKSKSKKKVTLTWTKDKTVTGYQVGFATTNDRSKLSAKTITTYKTTSKTYSGFKSKKKYYFWIRSYKTVGTKKYYSNWSNSKSVTIK